MDRRTLQEDKAESDARVRLEPASGLLLRWWAQCYSTLSYEAVPKIVPKRRINDFHHAEVGPFNSQIYGIPF